MIQLAVAGANGRVGQLVVKAIQQDPELKLATTLQRSNPEESQQDIKAVLSNSNTPIDVLIEFTTPEATLEHLAIAREYGLKMVIGTTGFSEAEKKMIQSAAKDIPIVLSPNMSIGVNISFSILELVANALNEKCAITISDLHHQHKKDAPSGTALRMADIIKTVQAKKQLIPHIEFFSERKGERVGDHCAVFSMQGESLEITHRASDRTLFAKGALAAAKWLIYQPPGLYDMQDVLGLRSRD